MNTIFSTGNNVQHYRRGDTCQGWKLWMSRAYPSRKRACRPERKKPGMSTNRRRSFYILSGEAVFTTENTVSLAGTRPGIRIASGSAIASGTPGARRFSFY